MRTPDHASNSETGGDAAHGLIIAESTKGKELRPSQRGVKEWARMIALHTEALAATSNGTSDSERKWQDYHLDFINLAKSRILLICHVNGYFIYRKS